MAASPGPRIYVIDDDTVVLDSTAFLLAALGYDCATSAAPQRFLEQASTLDPGCILTDLRMPGMNGFELAASLRDRGIEWPMLMMTSDSGGRVEALARERGFAALLHKPVNADLLAGALESAFAALDS